MALKFDSLQANKTLLVHIYDMHILSNFNHILLINLAKSI